MKLKLILFNKFEIMLVPVVVTILVLSLCLLGIGIKIWAKKDGEFSGTCASQNPYLNQSGDNCSFCGKSPEQFKECNGEKKMEI